MDPKIESRKDFYADGALEAERVVRIEADGSEVNHGAYVRLHQNGLKAEEGQFEDGKPIGRWRRWLETGANFFDGDYLEDGPSRPIEAAPDLEVDPIEEFAGPPLDDNQSRVIWLEFAAVLALVWLRPFIDAILQYVQPVSSRDSWFSNELSLGAINLASVLVLLHVIARSTDGWHAFGITRPRLVRDFSLGVMLALFMYESHVRAIEYVGGLYAPYHGHFDKPRAWEAAAILLGLVLNSFAEEFAMRGYAMRRIAQFSRSFGQTLVVPALLFASYHFYSGLGHVIVVFGHGLVLGLAYWWTRRIWPTIIAHTLYNLALYARAYEFIT